MDKEIRGSVDDSRYRERWWVVGQGKRSFDGTGIAGDVEYVWILGMGKKVGRRFGMMLSPQHGAMVVWRDNAW